MAKTITLKVEFTAEDVAKRYALLLRGNPCVRHVESSLDHPYKGELERVFIELKNRGVVPAKAPSMEKGVQRILDLDEAWTMFKDQETGHEVEIYFVLGNEPGIAVNNWSGCEKNLSAKVNEATTAVHNWYQRRA